MFEISTHYLHIAYQEQAGFTETYGFSGSQGAVNLEGVLLKPQGVASKTLLVMMHPSSTLQLLPLPRALAQAGAHVLCAASRYAKNDTALILEKVVLDLGAYLAHAKHKLGYEKIVLLGWSGGGALAMLYQAQAQQPTITHTPAGDAVNIKAAGLIPADAVIFQAAHVSRAQLLLESLDPSVLDENQPDERDASLDIYAHQNKAPFSAEFLARYRAAQAARMAKITAWAQHTLAALHTRNTGEVERGFIVHRTFADPRFIDATLDPNGRKANWCYLGQPETINNGPVGLARFTTLRSWLSQWSVAHSVGDSLQCVQHITTPLLVIENGADDGVPATHPRALFQAALQTNTLADKSFVCIEGANHYYANQPTQLALACKTIQGWLEERGL